jgi:uncharacterized Zn finger protein
MSRWYYRDFYTPSVPRPVKGGIKAQSKRGTFGQSWWAKRWIAVLESFDIGARLGRGRSYARRGQVAVINVEPGLVTAKVQGSRARPYEVSIRVKTLTNAEWKKLAKALATQAIFSAKLLAGEMPEDIEDAFKQANLALFPATVRDLITDCSCPDWSNPCKHIAAVYYLLGEEFDRDPFLIFMLRGMEREKLITLIGSESPANGRMERPVAGPGQTEHPLSPAEPLPEDPQVFWGQIQGQSVENSGISIPATSAALPRRLGNFPLWRGEEDFLGAMEKVYAQASSVGLDIFLGD